MDELMRMGAEVSMIHVPRWVHMPTLERILAARKAIAEKIRKQFEGQLA
jgi:hypothetical protein